MKLGSINVVVRDPEKALETFLKLFGTNNVKKIVKFRGLTDTIDTVDGYYLIMRLTNFGIYAPRNQDGRMAEHLKKYGEGIHHVEIHLPQADFEYSYRKFKSLGWPVSRPVWYGRLSEAIFWIEENGEQGVPIKFATKAYKLLEEESTVYLDTPRNVEEIEIREEYLRPRVELNTIVVVTNDFEKQQQIWTTMLSRSPIEIGDQFKLTRREVPDGRGNIFLPVMYMFGSGADVTRVNLYIAIIPDAPIKKFLDRRGKKVAYHNMTSFVTRDKMHDYWKQLEKAGFAMVDPKPYLQVPTGNYFFFVHPISTHQVLCEFVSIFVRDEEGRMVYDHSDSNLHIVSPEIS